MLVGRARHSSNGCIWTAALLQGAGAAVSLARSIEQRLAKRVARAANPDRILAEDRSDSCGLCIYKPVFVVANFASMIIA